MRYKVDRNIAEREHKPKETVKKQKNPNENKADKM